MTILRLHTTIALSALLLLPSCQSLAPMGPGATLGLGGSSRSVINRNGDASMVQLSDGTRWHIQPAGQAVTLTWQPNDPIEVIAQSHPSYPSVLSNLRTGQGTRARMAN